MINCKHIDKHGFCALTERKVFFGLITVRDDCVLMNPSKVRCDKREERKPSFLEKMLREGKDHVKQNS